jgi:ribosomal protein L18
MSLRHLLLQARRRSCETPPQLSELLNNFRSLSTQPSRASPAQFQLPQTSPCSDANPLGAGFHIDIVDSDLWPASFTFPANPVSGEECLHSFQEHEEEVHDSDDEIDDMRNRKKLFYKLDRGSKEFEENNLPLRRRWKRDKPNTKNPSESKKVEPSKSPPLKAPKLKAKPVERKEDVAEAKRDREPTFNQMTGPYHYPFCLDIHVSKGSVRACFVHRVTSRVVSVAHSISKDMKFDLGSRKGIKACVAVGALLAKRAIEDDIHNAIYTPRKGDKIEGKIEVVLRGIIENGVDVKVKLKQRKLTKVSHDCLLLPPFQNIAF